MTKQTLKMHYSNSAFWGAGVLKCHLSFQGITAREIPPSVFKGLLSFRSQYPLLFKLQNKITQLNTKLAQTSEHQKQLWNLQTHTHSETDYVSFLHGAHWNSVHGSGQRRGQAAVLLVYGRCDQDSMPLFTAASVLSTHTETAIGSSLNNRKATRCIIVLCGLPEPMHKKITLPPSTDLVTITNLYRVESKHPVIL